MEDKFLIRIHFELSDLSLSLRNISVALESFPSVTYHFQNPNGILSPWLITREFHFLDVSSRTMA